MTPLTIETVPAEPPKAASVPETQGPSLHAEPTCGFPDTAAADGAAGRGRVPGQGRGMRKRTKRPEQENESHRDD